MAKVIILKSVLKCVLHKTYRQILLKGMKSLCVSVKKEDAPLKNTSTVHPLPCYFTNVEDFLL